MAKDGSVMGVTHSRSSVLSHCRALTVACNYTEGAQRTVLSYSLPAQNAARGMSSHAYGLYGLQYMPCDDRVSYQNSFAFVFFIVSLILMHLFSGSGSGSYTDVLLIFMRICL